jgi:hypothetical protein
MMEYLPRSQSLEHGESRFQLQSPPNELWSLTRLCDEFGVSKSMIHGWIRSGRLLQAWLRRGGRSFWACSP